MNVPAGLFLLSLLAMALSWDSPDLFLLALLSAVASVVLLLLAWRKRAKPRKGAIPRVSDTKGGLFAPHKWVVIDGSNVMYWQDGTPQIATVQAVVRQLWTAGMTPGVVFDANAGYLLENQHLNDNAFAKRLGMPTDRVMVVPKGVQADAYILAAARDLGARVVSNDRFRDWAADYPEVVQSGYVIAGGYRDGAIWLNLPEA